MMKEFTTHSPEETEKYAADYEKLSELLNDKNAKEERLLELYEKLEG